MSRTLGLLLLGLLVLAALLGGGAFDGSDGAAQPTPAEQAPTAIDDAEALTLQGAPAAPTSASPGPVASAPQRPPSGFVLDRTAPPPFLRALPPAPPTPKMRVRGRLLDPDGTPAREGRIAVQPMSEPGGPLRNYAELHPCGADGTFEVNCLAGTHLHVLALSERAQPLNLERLVPAHDTIDLGDLRLEAGASLSGRVLVGGRPSTLGAFDLRIWAKDNMHGVLSSFESSAGMRALGLCEGGFRTYLAQATTNAEGEWHVEGLSPGVYRVTVVGMEQVQFHEALRHALGRDAVAPSESVDLDLQVSLLRVTAASAGPSLGVDFDRLEVTNGKGDMSSGDRVGRWAMMEADVRYLLVPADEPLEVRVQCRGHAPWWRKVRSPGPDGFLDLKAEVERAPQGVLQIRLPTRPLHTYPRLVFELREPGTSHIVLTGEASPLADHSHEARVPVGTWDIALRFSSYERHSRFALQQLETVTIGPNEPTTVEWKPPLGALLRVSVEGEVHTHLRCRLRRPGREDREVWFFPVLDLPADKQPGFQPLKCPLHSGGPYESADALEPGPLTLTLEAQGFAPYEQRLVLESGQIHQVTVRLTPR